MMNRQARRNRFVLVDPSLVAKDGDKWQYAVLFAKSAMAGGYDFVLLTHRQAPAIGTIDGRDVDQRGIFTATFFEHSEIVTRHAAAADGPPSRAARPKSKATAATRRGSPKDARRAPGADRALRTDKEGMPAPFNRDDFAVALAAELRALDLGEGDHVFFHTMTYGMLESLCEVTAALGLDEPIDADAHFLFHFGREAEDARTFLDRYYQFSQLETLWQRLRCGAPFRRLHFLATNPPLQDETAQILNAPVGLFEGLADLGNYFAANGGSERTAQLRRRVHEAQARRKIALGIRAGDLASFDAEALGAGIATLRRFGFEVELNVFFNAATLPLLRDLARQLAAIEPKFVDVSVNDHYIRAITGSTLMLLTYDAERYAKRVSAVLHDCSVLGVPAVVPAGSTLADAAHYARIFAYKGPADFAATLLCAARALCRDPERSFAKANIARKIYGADVVTRITANPVLSMRIARIGPIANLVMPLWGRVGSSHIIEAQIAFLLSRGYFVQQVFVLDKPADKRESIPYFWRMLYENSRHTRGCVQRIAFPRREDQAAIETAAQKAHLDAYQAYEHILAHADLEDPPFAARMRKAEVTIVNHVFHSGFAFAHSTKNRILESHDIQSYNLSRRPLLDPVTGAADPLSRIMTSEMASVAKYDYVVNIVPEEDAVLSIFNRRTKLVTPYIPRVETAPRYPSVAAFATKIGLHESYQRLDRFDLLFVGDSHQNNLAAGRWLLERVFNPYLLDRGFNLAICGRASDALYKEFEGLASVFFAGFVEDLASVYALSRLVLLPDQTGTGISIKALEALAAGKPVIATPVAVRGFGAKLPADFAIHREPAAYADAIVAALSRPERLRELTDISHRSYAQISSREAVEDSWDEVFRTLGIAPPVRTHAPAPARARPRHGHALNGGGPLNGSHRDGASSDDRRAPQRAARAHGDGVAPASRPAPNILHERWSLQHGGGPSGWEACRALLRWVAEGADVIAATLPGSYIERRLRESVEQEHLFLHAVPLETDPRRRAPRRRPHQPSLILGDRDRDVVAPARPWPAAPREARNRIRTLDTLYAGSHRPGLIVIEDASAAGAILEGAKSLLRQAPAVLVCLASAGAQDRAAVWRDCVERLGGRGYEWLDGLLTPCAVDEGHLDAAASGAGDVICALPRGLVEARLADGLPAPSRAG